MLWLRYIKRKRLLFWIFLVSWSSGIWTTYMGGSSKSIVYLPVSTDSKDSGMELIDWNSCSEPAIIGSFGTEEF